jgi:ABC-type transport system substrate-binding protein
MRGFIIALLIIATVVFVIIKATHKDEALTIGLTREPNTLNPLFEMNDEAKQITNLIFDGLTNPVGISNNQQQYTKGLASKLIEDAYNHKKWTIELKKGIKWHKTDMDFTADDVIFTWEAIHQVNAPCRIRLDRFIATVQKSDDYNITVTLRDERIAERVKDLLSFKIIPRVVDPALGQNGILPANMNESVNIVNAFNFSPVGTGCYYIAERPSSGEVRLEANELGVFGKPSIEQIMLKRYPGWDVVINTLNKGIVKLTADVPTSYFTRLEQSNTSFKEYSPYSFYCIVFNTRKTPFNRQTKRLGVARALDRLELAAAFFPQSKNVRDYLNQSIYPSNYEHVMDDPEAFLSQIKFDQRQSRQDLDGLSFDFFFNPDEDGEYARNLARSFQQMLSDVNASVNLVEAPNTAIFYSRLETGRFEAAFVKFSGFDHFYEMYDLLEKDGSKNYAGFVNSQIINRLSDLKLTLSYDDVSRITSQIHKIMDANMPLYPLFSIPVRAYYSPKLSNVYVNPEYYYNMIYQTRIMK